MSLTSFLKDILFPKQCFGCGRLGVYICSLCQKQYKTVSSDRCIQCMRRSYMGLTHPLCRTKYGINEVKSIFAYEGIVKKIIKQIKYRYVYEACDEFLRSISLKNRAYVSFFWRVDGNVRACSGAASSREGEGAGVQSIAFYRAVFLTAFAFSRFRHGGFA